MLESIEEQGNGINAQIFKALPDPRICRTNPIGIVNLFSICLVEHPFKCRYALAYENGNLCKHPGRKAFTEVQAK
jgi:hypothetical protein